MAVKPQYQVSNVKELGAYYRSLAEKERKLVEQVRKKADKDRAEARAVAFDESAEIADCTTIVTPATPAR